MKKYFYIVITLVAVFLVGQGVIALSNITYSEGDRVCVVDKFSTKGVFMKTWEGELQMRSIEQGGVPKTWEFSVSNPEAIKQVQDAMDKGHRAKLHYQEKFFRHPWKGFTKYFVTSATAVQ